MAQCLVVTLFESLAFAGLIWLAYWRQRKQASWLVIFIGFAVASQLFAVLQCGYKPFMFR
jgi:hypothetical protein